MAASKTPYGTKREPCPECGLAFSVKYIGQHLKKAHGISGGRSGQPRASRNGTPVITGFEVEGDFVVLSDSEGSLWLAEKIK